MKVCFTLCLLCSIGVCFAQPKPRLLKNINAASSVDSYGPRQILALNDRLLILNIDPEKTFSLWSSNGSVGNAVKLNTFPADQNGEITYLEGRGSMAFVITICCNGETANRVWITDGTTEGTHDIRDLSDSPDQELTFNIGVGWIGGNAMLYDSDNRLWKTDGTSEGTQISEVSIPPTTFWYGATFKNNFYFVSGTSLWKTNGTSDGTIEVTDLYDLGYHSDYISIEINALRDRMVFPVYGPDFKIGSSDGTAEGTDAFNLYGFSYTVETMDAQFVAEDGYFIGVNSDFTEELWRTDGTKEGTYPVTNSNLDFITVIARIGNTIYFSGLDEAHGTELWKVEGTQGSASMIMDINPGAGSSLNGDWSLTGVVDNKVYFTADDGVHGRELWVTDGTEEGTKMVEDLYPGSGASIPEFETAFKVYDNKIYFGASDPDNKNQVWVYDEHEVPVGLENDFESIDVYPNPAGNTIFINTTKEFHTVVLYDMLGRPVASVSIDQQATLDVRDLPRGMFVLTMKAANSMVSRKVMIK